MPTPRERRPPEPIEPGARPRVAVALDLDSGPRAPGSPPPPREGRGGAAPPPPALRLARQLATRLNALLLGLPVSLSAPASDFAGGPAASSLAPSPDRTTGGSPFLPASAGPSGRAGLAAAPLPPPALAPEPAALSLTSAGPVGPGRTPALPTPPDASRFAPVAALTSALLAAASDPATLLLVVPLPAAPSLASATSAVPLPAFAAPSPAVPPMLATLLAAATCPLLLVPAAAPAPVAAGWPGLRRLLVPLDGAPSTFRALASVVDLAERLGAALDLLYVADPAALPPSESGVLALPAYPDQPQHEWPAWEREVLTTLAAYAGRSALPVPARVAVAAGPAASAILAHAAEAGADALALVRRSYPAPGRAAILRALLARAARPILLAPAISLPPASAPRRRPS